jgi:D-beta-D-heptose 7-phosphate kinase/D-beta-D-heptose 1-phosphate adenosyltransferase
MKDGKDLAGIMQHFAGKRVLVLGDLMLDEHIWGEVGRISPEAPVIVVDAQEHQCRPGGAANVVNNVQALGARASVIGIVGADEHGRQLVDLLSSSGVDVSGVVVDPRRCTTRKTRIVAHSQQVVRVDRESRKALTARAVKDVVERLSAVIPAFDVVMFSDYDKGMAVRAVTQSVIDIAREHGKPVVVNSKPGNIKNFRSASVVTVNQSEAEAASGIQITGEKSLMRAAKRLMTPRYCGPEALVITRGPHGLSLFTADSYETIPAHLVEVYDVAGAGDTLASVLSMSLSTGATFAEAAFLANCAGGAVVRKVGVATVTREEIALMLEGAQ